MMAAFVWRTKAKFALLAADPAAGTPYGVGQFWGACIGALFMGSVLLALTAYLAWELTEWRRRLRAQSNTLTQADADIADHPNR